MYIPKYYQIEDISAIRDFIEENGFAILISQADGRPWATHIPLILDKNAEGGDVLAGHISKANRQWEEFENTKEVLAIFFGPHAYISSSWYDHENVPTWNYIAVHVYGNIRIIEGELLKKQLSKLVDKYESTMKNPVSIAKMSKGFVDTEMRGIVGIEIEIKDIQAAVKLSQNRDEKNYKNIIKELEQTGDINSLEIARRMKNRK